MFKNTAYHWVTVILKNFRIRLWIVLGSMLVFIIVFPLAYETAGPPAGALVTVMVLIASFLLGMKGGILVWALTVPIFAIQVSVTKGNGIQAALDNWPGIVATLVMTVVTGLFRNFITKLWDHHQAHVTVNEERLKMINDCFLSFDIEPEKNISRLTSVAGKLLGATYALYHRVEPDGSLRTIDSWKTRPEVIPEHDRRCRICMDAIAMKSEDVVVIESLGHSSYAEVVPDIRRYGFETYAAKTVNVDQELTGILTIMFHEPRDLTTAEREIVGIIASGIAVEEKRLHSERSTHESELSYIDLFNSAFEAIYILDADLRFINVNDGACRMYGYRREELIGRMPKFIAVEDRDDLTLTSGAIRSVYDTGEPASFESSGRRKNGEIFPMHVACTKGKYFGKDVVIVTVRELTDQKRMQEQLLQAQKLESLGTLTGGIAHDFNNLLAMILGSAEMLQSRLPEDSNLRKYADRIVDSSKRGTSITRQLLIFSRPDQAEHKQIMLPQLIGELESMLAHFLPKSISIGVTMKSARSCVIGDAGQIHQALLNLAINAGDAMKNTGTLTIRTFDAEAREVKKKFACSGSDPYVCISISDTGEGMDDETKAKIFDPFFSTKERGKGTGLGLAIVHSIVKHHNGFIDVASTPGFGTTFTLYLPALCAEGKSKMEAIETQSAQHETILIVDDEQVLRETIAEFLSDAGYHVHAAKNGIEGLQLFKKHRGSIDLVITDLGMPEMGGEDFYRCVHEIDPTVKVVVASGYLDGTTKEELLKLGIKMVLTKPCRMNDIHAAIRATLDKN